MSRNNKKLENDLIKKLKGFVDDDETIFGILVYVDNDEDRRVLLDFMNVGKEVDLETIAVLAIELDSKRK